MSSSSQRSGPKRPKRPVSHRWNNTVKEVGNPPSPTPHAKQLVYCVKKVDEQNKKCTPSKKKGGVGGGKKVNEQNKKCTRQKKRGGGEEKS